MGKKKTLNCQSIHEARDISSLKVQSRRQAFSSRRVATIITLPEVNLQSKSKPFACSLYRRIIKWIDVSCPLYQRALNCLPGVDFVIIYRLLALKVGRIDGCNALRCPPATAPNSQLTKESCVWDERRLDISTTWFIFSTWSAITRDKTFYIDYYYCYFCTTRHGIRNIIDKLHLYSVCNFFYRKFLSRQRYWVIWLLSAAP